VLLKVYQYAIPDEKVACKLHCTSTNLPKLKSTNVSNDKRNLAKVSNVGEGVCGFKPQSLQIEHFNEDEVHRNYLCLIFVGFTVETN